jgi:hypothetical protein
MSLRDAVGGVIEQGYRDSIDPYAMAEEVLIVVAQVVRRSCTPSSEAYAAAGDALVYAVADWIAAEPND